MNSRKIGTSEHIWYKLGQLGSNNFSMIARIHGRIEEKKLLSALQSVVDSQVILRAKVEDFRLTIQKKHLAKIQIIDRRGSKYWQEFVEEEMAHGIDVDSFPLWRFIWLKGEEEHEFIMTFNHMLSDGRSGLKFYECLLKKLDDPKAEIPENKLFPPYEKELKKTDGFIKSLAQSFKALNQYRENRKKDWFKFPACHKKEGATGIISRSLNQKQLSRLLQICKENKLTVSTYLSTLMIASFSEGSDKNVSLSLAVDMRPFLKNEYKSDIGYFVSTVDLVKDQNFKNTRDLAEFFKKKVKEQLNRSQFKFDERLRALAIKTTKDLESFRNLIIDVVTNSMLLTNIGKADIQTKFKAFELRQCFHVPAVHLMGVPFVCLAVSTVNNEMILNLTYTKAFISGEKITRLMDDFMSCLA